MLPIEVTLSKSLLRMQGVQSDPDRKNVVLALHGWLDNCYSFNPLAEFLKATNLLAFDLPGHGNSDQIPAGMSYDFHCYLIWLHELIAALDLETVTLVGHSMGAVIVSLYAGVYPEKVKSLVLIEGIGPFSVPELEAPAKMKGLIEGWMQKAPPKNSLFPSWEKAIKARQSAGRLSAMSAKILAERGAKSVDDGIMWKHDPRLKLPSRYQFSETQILAFLKNISCPTLLIEGTDSLLPTDDLMKRRRSSVSGLQYLIMEGGHHLHMDAPEAVAEAMLAFWDKGC